MKLADFIDGLNTLRPYFNDGDGYHIGAEHDQFYVYQTDRPLSAEDAAKMWALGWFQAEAGFAEDGETPNPYDPEDGWTCFT